MGYTVQRDGTVSAGPFPGGMNNKQKDHALPEGTARNIVNCDIDPLGNASRRKGAATKVYSGLGLKDGFGCPAGVFFVENNTLRILETNNTSTTIHSGITGTEFTFDYFDSVVYFSDGVISLKIIDEVAYNWGMAVPDSPTLSRYAGAYGEGTYLGAVCWVDSNGVESGASLIVSLEVPDSSGIVFDNLPVPTDPQVSLVRLYLSAPNGKELYHAADITPGTLTYSILAGRYDEGATLENKFVSPAPPGRVLCHYKGRSYVADDSGIVYYSEPFSFDQFKLGDSFLMFPEIVDIMMPTNNGIYFAYGEKTDFFEGTPEDGFNILDKLDYGGVYGTGKQVLNSDDVAWQSQRGLIVGPPNGDCRNIQEANVAVESAEAGASILIERDGNRQVIVTLKTPTVSKMAATSFIDAEIIRRAT